MLTISNLSFAYSRRNVLENLNLEIPEGAVCGLLAPNGTGKTTLLQVIMGALLPRKGSVVFNGVDTALRHPQTLAQMMLVPEEITLPGISLQSFIRLYGSMYPRFSAELMDRCIDEFRIRDIRKLGSLSMGQKKKVFLSMALACRPKLLLMDEPTNGLDIPGKAAMRRLLVECLDEDATVIISTHQVRDLEQMLERIVIMDRSNVTFNHTVGEIQQCLRFVRNVAPEQVQGAISAVAAPGGFDAMLVNNDSGTETPVNLEILFDYALREPEKLETYFSNLKKNNSDE
ncbi:MAG: ABC transporter ATP-binding protein [Bacteroidales bacterium]|nr:ABC transporter ATP-binding protein [Bacteroidales bacterium]